jgi:hypothetical protein
MSKVTFGYIVGGADKHYNNLLRSIESLDRIQQPYEVLILDADSRLEMEDDKPNVRIIPFPVNEEKDGGWFKPHYWQMRYHLNKYLETDYCFYMDTDTVIVNDRVDELIEEAENDFLICNHWWVPKLSDYLSRVRVNVELVRHLLDNEEVLDSPYLASGLFLFQKNKHDHIFETFLNKFNSIFDNLPNNSNPEGITDELLLALTLHDTGNYRMTNGAMNHSSEQEQMPLEFRDKTFWGKNPQDKDYQKVFAFHNDLEEFNTLSYFRKPGSVSEEFLSNFKQVCFAA